MKNPRDQVTRSEQAISARHVAGRLAALVVMAAESEDPAVQALVLDTARAVRDAWLAGAPIGPALLIDAIGAGG